MSSSSSSAGFVTDEMGGEAVSADSCMASPVFKSRTLCDDLGCRPMFRTLDFCYEVVWRECFGKANLKVVAEL